MMAIDASIYGNVGRGVRSVADYQKDRIDLEAADQARQINALGLLTGQQKYDEGQRSIKRADALRQLTGTWGSDTTDEGRIASLKNAGYFGEADALEKGVLERGKAAAENKLKNAQADNALLEQFGTRLKQQQQLWGSVQNPQQAAQLIQGAWQDPSFAALMKARGGSMEQQIAGIPQDPAQFQNYVLSQAKGIDEVLKFTRPDANATLSATTSAANNAATNARTAADAAAGRAVTMRGQNMTDARQRDLNTLTKEDKEATRKEAANEKAVTKFSDTLQKEGIPEIEAALKGAEAIFAKYTDPKTGKAKDVPGIGPIKNALPDWAVSSEGKDVRESMQAVANIVLSARSGAAVTDQELRRLARELSNSVGAGAEDMQRAYGKFRTRFETVKQNAAAGVSDAVKKTYEERGGVPITRGGAKPTNIDSLLDKYK